MQSMPKVSIVLSVYNAEGYIRDTIESVRAQSLANKECIIVDDGSTDNTLEVIRTLTSGDDSFIIIEQNHLGPGAAYNKALEVAKGRYIAFSDANGSYTEEGLENLYNTAFRKKADIAISNITELAGANEDISLMDPRIALNGTITGKLFKRECIEIANLKFEEQYGGEDMLFYHSFLCVCDRVIVCREEVYKQREIAATKENLPQTCTDRGSFKSLREHFDRILEITDNRYVDIRNKEDEGSAAEAEIDNQYQRFKSNLYCSFIRDCLFDDIYRHVWIADAGIVKDASELFCSLKENVFPHDLDRMLSEELIDMDCDDEDFMNPGLITQNPKITFAISDIQDAAELNRTIESIFCQNSPFFDVQIRSNLADAIDDEWRSKANIQFTDSSDDDFRKTAYEKCHSNYIWFIDRPLHMTHQLLRNMHNYMEANPGLLFTSVPLKAESNNGAEPLKSNSTAFLPEFAMQKRRTRYNQLDFFWINKLFTIAKLNAMKEPFGLDEWETLKRFYRRSRYHKISGLYALCNLTESDVLSRVRNMNVRLLWQSKIQKEERFKQLLEEREIHKDTAYQSMKRTRNRSYKFITLKIIYPLIYSLFRILPIDQKKVIFAEPNKLALSDSLENIKKVIEDKGGYNIISICSGRSSLRRKEQFKREVRFIKELATARYLFITDAAIVLGGFAKRKGTTVVQLWHACGAFKQFGFSTADLLFGGDVAEKKRYPDYRNLDLITVSSEDIIWAYEEAMGYGDKPGVVQATGVSRTDKFYDDDYLKQARENVDKLAPEARRKKIILYAPTFRGRLKLAKGPDKMDFRSMKEALGDEYFLLTKHHPFVSVPPIIPDDCRDFAKDVSAEASIDDLICCADICISDYSSLVFEYSLFDRPMVFFAYDLEEYDDWRGFYYDYDELTPGPIVYNTEGIIDYINNIENEFDKEEVKRFRNKFMSACDGHATERILDIIGIK